MIYRDNTVRLRTSNPQLPGIGYELLSGTFNLSGLSITSGQDPKAHNRVSQTQRFSADGKMMFRVGRKGSTTVARWWKDRVSAGQCTFNDTPNKLNFAFSGALTLNLKGGNVGRYVETYRFDEVYFAQGHTAGSNNWWFGGPNCQYIGDKTVRCKGRHLASGQQVTIDVRRGSNGDVANVDIRNIRIEGLSNWMSKLDGNKRLDEITLPGSHNAGMGITHSCAPGEMAVPPSQNHAQRVAGQLRSGARYLEVRVDYDKGQLVTYHRTGKLGCSGEYIASVLDSLETFLAQNPTETVLVKLSHIRSNSLTTKRLLDERLARFGRRYENAALTNLASIKLDDLRGKAIFVYDFDEYISPANGRFRYRGGKSGNHLAVYDSFTNTTDLARMAQDQLSKWKEFGGYRNNRLFLLSWTLTPGAVDSVAKLAKRANDALAEALTRYSREYDSKPNIVFIDFLDDYVTSAIVSLNGRS